MKTVRLSVTRPQVLFDITFGAIGPILCFVFDPLVFRNGIGGAPLLSDYRNFVYLFSGLQIALLCLWLLTGPAWQVWNRLIGGMLLCGGIFCLVVGLALAPFSLFGMFLYGIGIFGFTPFLTALVYLRNSSRALRAEKVGPAGFADALIPVSGMLLVAGLPLLLSIQIHLMVSRGVSEILEGDSQRATFAAHRLAPLSFFANSELDQIVNAYSAASDERRRELLKSCYQVITGESIENRAGILADYCLTPRPRPWPKIRSCQQADRTPGARGDIVIAIRVDVVLPIEQVCQIGLQSKLLVEFEIDRGVGANVARENDGVIDRGEHVIAVYQAQPIPEPADDLIVVPKRKGVPGNHSYARVRCRRSRCAVDARVFVCIAADILPLAGDVAVHAPLSPVRALTAGLPNAGRISRISARVLVRFCR